MSDKTHEEELAALRATVDQGREAVREMAKMVWSMYAELVDLGFNEMQSLSLCSKAMQTLMTMGQKDD